MLIVCPSCTTAYRIELSALGAGGRSVRCARCRNVWFASMADVASTALTVMPGHDRSSPQERPDPPLPGAENGADDAGRDGAGFDARSEGARDVTIAHAPSLVPTIAEESTPQDKAALDNAAAGPDIETLAARRERRANESAKRRRSPRSWPGLPAVILVLAALLAALVNWRASVVHVLPQTASLFSAVGLAVNVRGLSFDNVKTSVESREGAMVLVVEGTIANLTRQTLEVPRLRFAVRNGPGYEVYAWTALPAQSALAPGDSVPFRTRLASPPADGQQVIVRFFNRRDVAAGTN
jgi:predicted Zn finger-like uncharacterized protein